MTSFDGKRLKPLALVAGYGLALLFTVVSGGLPRKDSKGRDPGPQTRPSSPQVKRSETLTYAVGYGLALVLTGAAFGLVWLQLLSGRIAFYAVLGLGFVQMLVHFRCFLHIDLKRNARADLQLLLFSALIVGLMVGGTLVILFNLHSRMMGPS